MKWYFVLNEQAHRSYFDVAKVAVLTCLKNTTLAPNLIFDGAECEFTTWMRDKGVRVHFAQLPFIKKLYEKSGVRQLNPDAARGAYLRVMIPKIESEDQYVLYTDSDVVFRRDPVDLLRSIRPKVIAATSEFDRLDCSFFNSGVMVINVDSVKPHCDNLLDFISNNLPYWNGFSPNDQGALNYFFRGHWEYLSPLLNWKPYWGVNSEAYLVHYHGNRPTEVIKRTLIDFNPNDDKSPGRKHALACFESRAGLLLYNREYFSEYQRAFVKTSMQLRFLAETDKVFLYEVKPGDQFRGLPAVSFYVIGDDGIESQHDITLSDKKSTVPFTFEIDKAPHSSRPCLVSREFIGIASDDNCTLLPADELSFIKRKYPTSSALTEVRGLRERTLSRVWTLPKLSASISWDNSGACIVDLIPDAPRMELRLGPCEVRSAYNTGIKMRDLGDASFLPRANEVGPPAARIFFLLQLDNAESFSERLLSLTVQISCISIMHRDNIRILAPNNITDSERDLLKLIGCDTPTAIDSVDDSDWEECLRVDFAISSTFPPEACDFYFRRLLQCKNKGQHTVQLGRLQNDCNIDDAVRVYADSRISNIKALDQLMTAGAIFLSDQNLAWLLLFAHPQAVVVHIFSAKTKSSDKIVGYSSLRNLLYVPVFVDTSSSGDTKKHLMAKVIADVAVRLANKATAIGPVSHLDVSAGSVIRL